MNSRERVLATIRFKCPDSIPVNLWTVPAVYVRHGSKVDELVHRHQHDIAYSDWDPASLDPRMKPGLYRDEWGCLWQNKEEGYFGMVVECPFEDYGALDGYRVPYEEMEEWVANASTRHPEPGKFWLGFGGDFFHRMCWLRGMDRVMLDLIDGTKGIYILREMLLEFFSKQVSLWTRTECDGVVFCDDWGSQTQLFINPDMWRSFAKPVYKQFFDICKSAGKYVFFHSDGYIMEIIDDLIELGVDALNCQVWCMGPETLGKRFRGRITFWGELDRQRLIPWGTPEEIYAAAAKMKEHLALPEGGFIGQAEVDGLTSLENIEAVLTAWNR